MSVYMDGKKGYTLIEPTLDWPRRELDDDERVRCLAYLCRHIHRITSLPLAVSAEVIVAEYTGPYPAIGLSATHGSIYGNDFNIFRFQDELDAFVTKMSLQKLTILSAEEDLNWQSMLSNYLK
jgi:hypothetical protein